jgi:RimJ/RimL family protein N-acetyltransferase
MSRGFRIASPGDVCSRRRTHGIDGKSGRAGSSGAGRLRLFGRLLTDDDRSGLEQVSRTAGGDGEPAAHSGAGAPACLPRRIATARLTLELPTAADYPFVRGMASEPSMFAHSERATMSAEDAWNLLLRHIGHWGVAGFGAFAVRERVSGQFVGLVGASSFRRELGPDFGRHPEFTWSIVEKFRGRGYATEAAAAVIDAFDARPDAGATICLIHVENQASMRVAAKLGFRMFRRCDYRGYPAGLLSRRPGAREVHHSMTSTFKEIDNARE